MKRGRSDSTTLAQRVPLGPSRGQVAPPVANPVHAGRVSLSRVRVPIATGPKRASRIIAEQIREEIQEVDLQSEMEIENEQVAPDYDEDDLLKNERAVGETEDEDAVVDSPYGGKSRPPRCWPEVDTARVEKYRREVEAIREVYQDPVDMYDMTMVSEYSEEIFEYMSELEVGYNSV